MRRQAFSLVELLVVITIMLVLMGLAGAALSNGRNSQKRQETQGLIAKLDAVIQQHFTWCQSLRLPGTGSRADLVARRISGDMPDTWTDVAYMADRPTEFTSGPQRTYAGIWKALQTAGKSPTASVADAECLYMMVIRGGLADCLTCSDLDGIGIGDTDGDGALEFLDPWGNPIRFVLWPQAFENPPGTPYFADGRTRPLVFSAGPDGLGTTSMNASGNLPSKATGLGGCSDTGADRRADNVTNFDAEARR